MSTYDISRQRDWSGLDFTVGDGFVLPAGTDRVVADGARTHYTVVLRLPAGQSFPVRMAQYLGPGVHGWEAQFRSYADPNIDGGFATFQPDSSLREGYIGPDIGPGNGGFMYVQLNPFGQGERGASFDLRLPRADDYFSTLVLAPPASIARISPAQGGASIPLMPRAAARVYAVAFGASGYSEHFVALQMPASGVAPISVELVGAGPAELTYSTISAYPIPAGEVPQYQGSSPSGSLAVPPAPGTTVVVGITTNSPQDVSYILSAPPSFSLVSATFRPRHYPPGPEDAEAAITGPFAYNGQDYLGFASSVTFFADKDTTYYLTFLPEADGQVAITTSGGIDTSIGGQDGIESDLDDPTPISGERLVVSVSAGVRYYFEVQTYSTGEPIDLTVAVAPVTVTPDPTPDPGPSPYTGPDVPPQGPGLRRQLDQGSVLQNTTTAQQSPQVVGFGLTPLAAGRYALALTTYDGEVRTALYATLRRSDDSSLVASFDVDVEAAVTLGAISYDLDVYAETQGQNSFMWEIACDDYL